MVGRETNIDYGNVNGHMAEPQGPRGGIVCLCYI